MILFHYRAEKLAAGDGFAPSTSLSKSDEFLLLYPASLVEPEVVATSPSRIKSPMPVYCGFSSVRSLKPARLPRRRPMVG